MLNEDREKHIFAVAEMMYDEAKKRGMTKEEANEMFTLGLMHDIGYKFSDINSEHPKEGGEILKKLGYKYHKEVSEHGNPNAEFTTALEILNLADMSVGPTGEIVGADKRVADIGARYGKESKEYTNAVKTKERLGI